MIKFWKKLPERRDWAERAYTAKSFIESKHLDDIFDILRSDCARDALCAPSIEEREQARCDFHAIKRLETKLHSIANYGKIKENKAKSK